MLANRKFIRRRGFTLIELLVVISIIGILSAIGLASYNGIKMKARDARRKADLSQIRLGLALYASGFTDTFPTAKNYPNPDVSVSMLEPDTIFSNDSNSIIYYIGGAVLIDPVNSVDQSLYYSYDVSADRQQYVLCAHLESGSKNWIVFYEDTYGGEQTSCPEI